MNISLTILCVIAVLFAVVAAFLGQDDVESGVIFPWQIVGSCAIGFLITHGQYYLTTYAWMYERLMGDGAAGMVISAGVASFVEAGVAGLPLLAGVALYFLMSAWDKRFPLTPGAGQSRRVKLVAFLRGFSIH